MRSSRQAPTTPLATGRRAKPVQLLGHKRDVLGASFRPGDGSSILTASEDGFARLWDPYGEPPLRSLADAESGVTDVGVNPSGSLIAVGRQDGSVQVLTTDGQVRSTFSLGSRRVVSVGWTNDGTLLAASLTGHVQIREDSGRRLLRELDHRSRIGAAAISRDGTLAATGGQDGNGRLWRLPGGTPLRVLPHDGPVTSLAIDPAAHTIASASGSTAYLWPVAGGEARLLRDPDSEGNVTGVAFGRRGRSARDVQRERRPALGYANGDTCQAVVGAHEPYRGSRLQPGRPMARNGQSESRCVAGGRQRPSSELPVLR